MGVSKHLQKTFSVLHFLNVLTCTCASHTHAKTVFCIIGVSDIQCLAHHSLKAQFHLCTHLFACLRILEIPCQCCCIGALFISLPLFHQTQQIAQAHRKVALHSVGKCVQNAQGQLRPMQPGIGKCKGVSLWCWLSEHECARNECHVHPTETDY